MTGNLKHDHDSHDMKHLAPSLKCLQRCHVQEVNEANYRTYIIHYTRFVAAEQPRPYYHYWHNSATSLPEKHAGCH